MDFNAAAGKWDTDRRAKRAHVIASEIENVISGMPYGTALEFGCGTGLVGLNLRHAFREITLLDNSGEMIESVRAKIRENGIRNMKAVSADLTAGGTLPGTYDFIFMSMALHHIADTKELLSVLAGSLEKGGCICIVDLMEDDGSFHREEKDFTGHNGFDPAALAEQLRDIGLTETAVRIIYSDKKEVEGREVPYSLFLMTASKRVPV